MFKVVVLGFSAFLLLFTTFLSARGTHALTVELVPWHLCYAFVAAFLMVGIAKAFGLFIFNNPKVSRSVRVAGICMAIASAIVSGVVGWWYFVVIAVNYVDAIGVPKEVHFALGAFTLEFMTLILPSVADAIGKVQVKAA